MKKILIAIILVSIGGFISCKKGDIRGIGSDLGTTGSYLTLVKNIRASIGPDKINTDIDSIEVGFKGSAIDSIREYVILYSNTDSTTTALPCIRCQSYSSDSTTWHYIKSVKFPDSGRAILTVSGAEIKNSLYNGDSTQFSANDLYRVYFMIITKDGRHFSSANTNTDFEGQPGYNMAMHWDLVIACPINTLTAVQQYLSGTFLVTEDQWLDYKPSDPTNNTVTVYPSTDPNPAVAALNLAPNQFALDMYPSRNPLNPPGSSSSDRQLVIATIAADGLSISVVSAFTGTSSTPNFIGNYIYPTGYPVPSPDPLGQTSTGAVSSCNGKGKVTLKSTFYQGGSTYCCFEAIIKQE